MTSPRKVTEVRRSATWVLWAALLLVAFPTVYGVAHYKGFDEGFVEGKESLAEVPMSMFAPYDPILASAISAIVTEQAADTLRYDDVLFVGRVPMNTGTGMNRAVEEVELLEYLTFAPDSGEAILIRSCFVDGHPNYCTHLSR